MILTQKGKLNSHQRWMEKGNWLREGVRRGTGMVIKYGEGRRKALNVRMDMQPIFK